MKLKFKRTTAALLSAVMVISSANAVFADEAEEAGAESISAEEETLSGSALTGSSETEDEADASQIPTESYTEADLSMLPLKEVECALDLYVAAFNGDVDDFSAIEVSYVIANLQYSDGSYVQDGEDAVSDDDVIVWSYYKDDDGNQITDKYGIVERTDTVDLTPPEGAGDFDIEIIAGSGDPLDLNNVRYIVRIFTDEYLRYGITYEIYAQKDGSRTKVDLDLPRIDDSDLSESALKDANYIPSTFSDFSFYYYTVDTSDEEIAESDLYLGLNFGIEKRSTIELKIYEDYAYPNEGGLLTPFYVDEDFKLHDNETDPNIGYSSPLNSSLLNVDMSQNDAGVKMFDNEFNGNIYYAVLVYLPTNEVVSIAGYSFWEYLGTVAFAPAFDSLYKYDNGVEKQAAYKSTDTSYAGMNGVVEYKDINVIMNANYSASDDYYLKLRLYSDVYQPYWSSYIYAAFKDEDNILYDIIKSNYETYYEYYLNLYYNALYSTYYESYYSYYISCGYSETVSNYYAVLNALSDIKCFAARSEFDFLIENFEAYGYADIKEDLFANGYEDSYSDTDSFVIIYDPFYFTDSLDDMTYFNNFVRKVNVSTSDFNISTYNFESPVIGSSDPYFQLQGVEGYDSYVIENGGHYTLDTYYGYGYQSVLINDENVDLSQVKPILWSGYDDIFNLYQVSSSGSSLQDFADPDYITEENQQYTLTWQIDETDTKNRNYWLTLVKKSTGGPKLFVNGPGNGETRDVIFGESGGVDYGDSHTVMVANTGDEPMYVTAELINAQNVKIDDYWGLDGVYSLAAFTSVSTDSEYSEPDNIAKVVLVPDGDGEAGGLLTIHSAGSLNSDGSLNTNDNYETYEIIINGTKTNPEFSTTELPNAVKYVPYQKIIATDNIYTSNKVSYAITGGTLPDGVTFDEETGEIYGVPQETGEYTFTVTAYFSDEDFESISQELTLMVLENTDENVDAQTDEGFEIITYVPDIEVADEAEVTDEIFEFTYDYEEHVDEYQNFWYDGQALTEGVDYDLEAGSTKITIKSQTITDSGEGTHTIAGEYRNTDGEVKKAAQNFSYSISSSGGSSSGGSSSGGSSSGGSSSGGSSSGGSGGGSSSTTKYTVSYESNGGSAVESQSVSRGNKVSFLATPEKAGYSFAGWYTDEELTNEFDQNTVITASIKLYAKWEQISCRIWFNSNGGNDINSVEVLGDTAVEELPEPEREGYSFAGWYTDEGLTSEFKAGSKVTANMTLYAKWEVIIPDEAPEEASGFIDVSENSWYYNDVNEVYGLGIMVGYNNALFGPDDVITLSNIVTIAAKLSGEDISKYENSEAVSGIEENRWYTPYAKWAYKAGLAEGEFNADEKLSREAAAVILYDYLEYKGIDLSEYDQEAVFADEDLISDNNKKALKILYNMGIIAGRGNGIIDPASTITRGEFAALVNRINNKI